MRSHEFAHVLHLPLTNVQKGLYGKAVIGVSAKLGLLVKTAMFEEIETELQEFATFMTQVKFLFYVTFQSSKYVKFCSHKIRLDISLILE